MPDDLIETICKPCGYAGYLPEGAFCPACGEGPPIRSRERVDRLYGLPVRMPADPAGRIAALLGTRPARQTIPRRRLDRTTSGQSSADAAKQPSGAGAASGSPDSLDADMAPSGSTPSLSRPNLVARGLTERQIRTSVALLRAKEGRAPTRDRVAEALGTSTSTLARAMAEMGMRRWPPPPPDD